MAQSHFDFTAPFSGSTPLSKHTSWLGAQSAAERIGRQSLELLTAYRERGPLTDAEAAEVLNVERSTINARRNELVQRGLVEAIGTKENPQTGVQNVTWYLQKGGSRAVYSAQR